MIDRRQDLEAAVEKYIKSGQTLMVGGFGRGGVPFTVLEYLADRPEKYRDFILVKNDASEPPLGIGPLLKNLQATKLIATHIGLNPVFIQQMNDGEVACELVPQGIFAERIRAGGAGIPAFLTDIGMGTIIDKDKQRITLDEKEYLLEKALRGDVALICADKVDHQGNCWFAGSNRNMCAVMAMACDRTIVEAKEIVAAGDIPPESVHIPHVYIDAVVQAQPRRHQQEEAKA